MPNNISKKFKPKFKFRVQEFGLAPGSTRVFYQEIDPCYKLVSIQVFSDYINPAELDGVGGSQIGVARLIVRNIRDRYVLNIYNDAFVYNTNKPFIYYGRKNEVLMVNRRIGMKRKVKLVLEMFPNPDKIGNYRISFQAKLEYAS